MRPKTLRLNHDTKRSNKIQYRRTKRTPRTLKGSGRRCADAAPRAQTQGLAPRWRSTMSANRGPLQVKRSTGAAGSQRPDPPRFTPRAEQHWESQVTRRMKRRGGRQRQVPHLRGRRRRRGRGARNGGRPSRSPHDRSQGKGVRRRTHRRQRNKDEKGYTRGHARLRLLYSRRAGAAAAVTAVFHGCRLDLVGPGHSLRELHRQPSL